ncbi:hypothetical protein K504DRAFT_455583 [Pleomassaria siparia CBS 279.74]|uniref:Uncharacterized protein n=1 Tax=Pleomassaria siparia CBS 279.74 TaxID=1314801 RepID=A0A6G1K732_9PLEO|nr:hypothetical protein K504DRAFT_455583 [Pleomassaria siparia CBS 279.74]
MNNQQELPQSNSSGMGEQRGEREQFSEATNTGVEGEDTSVQRQSEVVDPSSGLERLHPPLPQDGASSTDPFQYAPVTESSPSGLSQYSNYISDTDSALVEAPSEFGDEYNVINNDFDFDPGRWFERVGQHIDFEYPQNGYSYPNFEDGEIVSLSAPLPSFVTPNEFITSNRLDLARRRRRPDRRAYDVNLRGVSAYDYNIPPSSPTMNFTAVEIITYLPKWYQQYMVASRFVNNRLIPPIHLAILRTHREEDTDSPFKRNSLDIAYNGTMRKMHGRAWLRKNHLVPDGWDDKNIAVNGFMPDRVLLNSGKPEPDSVPFRQLIVGVKQTPQGADTADLTRAIQFALSNHRTDHNGNEQEYMFPDDLRTILSIIGYTHITDAHTDKEVVKRYMNTHVSAPGPPFIPTPQIYPGSAEGQSLSTPVRARSVPAVVQNLTAEAHQSPYTPSPVQKSHPSAYQNPYTQGLIQGYFPPAPVIMKASLIRYSTTPEPKETNENAQIIRFAQRPANINIDYSWKPNHVGHIIHILRTEWIQQLNVLLDSVLTRPDAPLWRDVDLHNVGNDMKAFDRVLFATNSTQLAINWRVDPGHERVLGRLNISESDMTVKTANTVYSGASSPVDDPAETVTDDEDEPIQQQHEESSVAIPGYRPAQQYNPNADP